MIAKYKCLKCKHGWEGKCGPTMCPKCNHLYIKWLNVKEVLDQIEVNRYFKF